MKLLLAVVALLFVLPAPMADAASYEVHMSGYAFGPAQLSVKVGDTVTFTNHDQAAHNAVVTSGPAQFSSPMLATGQSWSFTFSQPGTYSYYCSVHPDMRAQITVQAVAAQPQPQQPQPQQPQQSTTKRQPARTTPAQTSTAAAAPAPAVDSPTTSMTEPDVEPVTATAAPPQPRPTLDPLLLVAGVVAAVATLCLLLIGSRQAAS